MLLKIKKNYFRKNVTYLKLWIKYAFILPLKLLYIMIIK